MENVKIIGNHNPKLIVIQPQDESKESVNLEGNSLDISEYQGEVEITGIKSSDVIYNPQTQFVITADLVEKVDWKGLGISSFSIWRISARKVAAAKCVEGIFDMPNKKDEDYDTDMRELEILYA